MKRRPPLSEELSEGQIDRGEDQLREQRIAEAVEANVRAFEIIINRYARELGWWTLKKLGIAVVMVVVAAASLVIYFKFPKP